MAPNAADECGCRFDETGCQLPVPAVDKAAEHTIALNLPECHHGWEDTEGRCEGLELHPAVERAAGSYYGTALCECNRGRGEGRYLINHKKLFRLYREEKLTVRRRGGRKRAIGTRAPMLVPMTPNDRWPLDFVSDQLTDGRRFRILTVVDDCTRECLALVADTSLSESDCFELERQPYPQGLDLSSL
ncbi:hypothetical protein AB7M46_005782 [Bradyrhizobium elkanii]